MEPSNDVKIELEKFFKKQMELYEGRLSLFTRVSTLVIASVSLIAALAWDDALKKIFDHWFGGRESLGSALAFAIIITILAAIISVSFSRTWHRNKNENKEE